MPKVIDYRIELERDTDRLSKCVIESLANGYQPLGAPFSAVDPDSRIEWYYQAMVKYEAYAVNL